VLLEVEEEVELVEIDEDVLELVLLVEVL